MALQRSIIVSDDPHYETLSQVCNRFQWSPSTLERRLRGGSGFPQPVKLGSRVRRWSVKAIEAWETKQARRVA
jgi:predicted DNA-binding transcriptional regulator AlpA